MCNSQRHKIVWDSRCAKFVLEILYTKEEYEGICGIHQTHREFPIDGFLLTKIIV